MVHKTTTRVAEHTSLPANEKIQNQTQLNIRAYGSSKETINARLEQLDREWDIERALEANGSTLLLLGLGLSLLSSRRWLILPMLVGGFCLQHAIQGWCPPLEAFRRLGIRTASEIEQERVALKALRGDFKDIKH